MKDAQDAVKEIREWPKLTQDYLVEHHDGSIGFVNEMPPLMVCSREEFMEAKAGVKTMADAVRELKGLLVDVDYVTAPGNSDDCIVFAKNAGGWHCWVAEWTGQKHGWYSVGTRAEFEAEARRQGYLGGLEGYSDDVAFNGEWFPKIGEECQIYAKSNETPVCKKAKITYQGNGVGCYKNLENGNEYSLAHRDYEFRPLEPDRERWVEAAINRRKAHHWTDEEFLSDLHDALKSGELPMPEKD